MRIQHNIMAMSAYRNYTNNVSAMQKNLEKLSSGYKINRAGDDAAGLAISEKMRAQITGLETAQKNAKDGISLVQTAEGALTEVHDMLNRMVELATQSANGTYDDSTDRYQLQKEMNQLRDEINRIADSSNFNGIQLLDGSMSLNETSPITVSATSNEAGDPVVNYADATTVFGPIPDVTGNTPGSTGDTVLHAGAPSAAIGEFTVALDQLALGGVAAGATGTVSLTVGTATVSVKAAAASVGMTGRDIATQLATGAGAYFTVASDKTTAFATSGSLGNNKLVYKATDNSDGTVTYKLAGYTNGTGTLQAVASTTALAGLSDTVLSALGSADGLDLNMTVKASAAAGKGTLTDNRQNYGTIDVANSQFQGKATFGNGQAAFNASALASADNVKITIGTGDDAVTLNFKLTENGEPGDVDLTNVDSADYAQAIAKAFNAQTAGSSGIGIFVGVNGSGAITLSEITNGAGTSTAPTAIQEAMSSVDGFNSLLSVQLGKSEAGAEATNDTTLTVDAHSIYEGNSAEITVNGETTKYVFTSDESKLTATDVPAGTKYVALGSDVVKNLASAIGHGAAVSSSNANKIVIKSSGDDLVTVGTGVTWTGNMGLTLQIGDTAASYNQLNVNISDCHTYAMGDGTTSIADISIATQKDAQDALDVIKAAVNYVSDVRGTLGATQNRLDHTINNLSVMTENIQDAESTIRDVDVAEEMMAYTKNNILIQASQAMLAQANQVPQGVLQLLQ